MSRKPVFSRKALNILIFITATLILVFSQFGDETSLDGVKSFHGDKEVAAQGSSSTGEPSDDYETPKVKIKDFFPELADIPEIPKADIDFDVQHWTTKSGLKVYFVPAPEIPMVDLRLVFNAGSAQDKPDEAGLASMTSNLVKAGTANLDVNQVALELERIGADVEVGAYRDMAVAGLRVLVDPQYFNDALKLYSQIISEMNFTDEDLAREKNRQLVGITHKQQSPQAQISDAVFETLYGAEHPYGHPSSGTLESVTAITRQDIEDFHNTFYVTENASLAMVGDIDRKKAEAIAEEVATQLGHGKAAPALVQDVKNVSGVTEFIQFPSEQTHIAMVGPGVKRGDEDYYALFLADHILGGGGFASLLNKKIRQEKAYAYSVGSGVSPMAGTGLVTIQMQTRGDQAAAAIEATRQVIDELAQNGPTEAEMEDAKQQILSEFAMRAASNSSQLGYLGSIGFYDLPLNYLSVFNEKIEAVTAEDVKKMVSRYFKDLGVVTLGYNDPLNDASTEDQTN